MCINTSPLYLVSAVFEWVLSVVCGGHADGEIEVDLNESVCSEAEKGLRVARKLLTGLTSQRAKLPVLSILS